MTNSTCHICKFEFTNRREMFDHKKAAHGGKAPCPQCGVWVKSITYHVRDLHARTTVDVTCNTCNIRFQRVSSLRLHIRRQHQRPKSIRCTSCTSTFVYQNELNSHVKSRHQERHPCNNCEKTYSDRSGLWAHNRAKHCGMKDTCAVCGGRFSSKYALRGHVESVHENKQWSCPQEGCGKMFKHKSSSIEHHRALHQGQRHRCAVCNRSFTRPDSLSSHKRRIHLGLERGRCGHCEKTFNTRASLRKHLSTQHPQGLGPE